MGDGGHASMLGSNPDTIHFFAMGHLLSVYTYLTICSEKRVGEGHLVLMIVMMHSR